MRKFEIKDSNIMQVAVQQEILRSDESRYDHRLHGILLVCSGFSCYEVADLFKHSPRTIQYWVHRFEQSGFEGLKDMDKPGRPSAITEKIRNILEKDLRRSPREFGYQQNLWDGKLLSHHLAKRKKVDLGVRQCQRLFHQFGFRRRKPRPMIADADPVAQEAYKKT
ncbi:MAG: helix-turn-helix domain-containing protein [Planctomycetes bacterium]|nr:helix-turn-helix domain-containing protein [Planctomycetota bacterium]